jgi:hypothetical protein
MESGQDRQAGDQQVAGQQVRGCGLGRVVPSAVCVERGRAGAGAAADRSHGGWLAAAWWCSWGGSGRCRWRSSGPRGCWWSSCLPEVRLYCVPPNTPARARERYRLSGAKSDRFDAFVLADTLWQEHWRWRPPPCWTNRNSRRRRAERTSGRNRPSNRSADACTIGARASTTAHTFMKTSRTERAPVVGQSRRCSSAATPNRPRTLLLWLPSQPDLAAGCRAAPTPSGSAGRGRAAALPRKEPASETGSRKGTPHGDATRSLLPCLAGASGVPEEWSGEIPDRTWGAFRKDLYLLELVPPGVQKDPTMRPPTFAPHLQV